MSSTRTRLSLRARCLAIVSTCLATFGGKVTLRRTCLARACFVRARFAIAIVAPVYTIVVHIAECRTHPFAESAKRVLSTRPRSRNGGETWGTRLKEKGHAGKNNCRWRLTMVIRDFFAWFELSGKRE